MVERGECGVCDTFGAPLRRVARRGARGYSVLLTAPPLQLNESENECWAAEGNFAEHKGGT